MAGVTYKCPSCGAYLTYQPDTGEWGCDFCGARFDEQTLLETAEGYEKHADAEAPAEQADTTANDGATVVYHCPNCGSSIETDETTVATSCYYCHSPVVLQGKLTNEMKPDEVLPFSIGRETALEKFTEWVKKKRFVPSDLLRQDQLETISGVYYPHFVSTCEVDGAFSGEGLNTSVTETFNYVITKTDHYAVRRRGRLTFRNVIRPALTATDRKLSDGIHPFPLEETEKFSSAYLSGFLAERRDMDSKDIHEDVQQELEQYIKPILTRDAQYSSISGQSDMNVRSFSSKYVLLPTWVMTYRAKDGKEPYHYVMNGRTGAVCGKLPINQGKLFGWALGAGLIAFALACGLLYLL